MRVIPGQVISQFSVVCVGSTELPRICLPLQGGADGKRRRKGSLWEMPKEGFFIGLLM